MPVERMAGTRSKEALLESLLDRPESEEHEGRSRLACRILIVEDVPETAKNIRLAFENVDRKPWAASFRDEYNLPKIVSGDEDQIRWVTNYEDARSEILAASIDRMLDLVILDLHIPKGPNSSKPDPDTLHGIDLLREIRGALRRKLGYHLPVVILSANVKTSGEHSYGFDAFKKLLEEKQAPVLPDEILLKEDEGDSPGYVDSESLLRKTAKYLIDLTKEEEDLLTSTGGAGLIIPPHSVTRRILRQLKGVARSAAEGRPLPDVLLLGENGVGKSTFARAYDVLRRQPVGERIAFSSQDLGSLDIAGSAANLRLFGGTDFADGSGRPEGAWTLGAFSQSTYYRTLDRNTPVRFRGQVLRNGESGITNRAEPLEPNRTHYPGDQHEPDYEASGTLFLDEVVNVSDEMQARLLQALGYDRTRRHVFTTGRVSRKVPIGPTIVMATRKKIDHMAREDAGESLAMRDYLFRIDQVRVNIPPLRDRREEIIPYLLAAVEKRRADNGEPRRQIAIDKRVEHVLMHQLQYPNNFADLERIADRIRPEENTITFSHLRELYEREVLFDLREEIRSRFGTIEGCIQYFKEIDGGKDSVAWTDLASLFDLRPSEVYTLGCSLFVHLKRSTWPANDDEIAKYFGVGQTAEGFKGFMSRLSNEIKPGVRPSEAIQNWIKGLNDGRNAPIPSARSQERSDRIVKRRRPSQSRIELEQ